MVPPALRRGNPLAVTAADRPAWLAQRLWRLLWTSRGST